MSPSLDELRERVRAAIAAVERADPRDVPDFLRLCRVATEALAAERDRLAARGGRDADDDAGAREVPGCD